MKKRYYILLPLLSLAGLLLAYLLVLAVLDPFRIYLFIHDQKNSGPVQLYGRVVDGHSTPVADAMVVMKVEGPSIWYLFGGERGWSSAIERVTDAAGRFEVHGYRGDMLRIEKVFKPDYIWKPPEVQSDDNNRGFQFGASASTREYAADSNNPAIYVLKLRGDNATTRTSRGGWTGGKRGEPVLPLPPSRWSE